MNFSCEKENLLKALSDVVNVTEKKTTMPILANLLLEVNDKELSVNGTDLAITVISSCPVKTSQSGKLCTPALQLLEIVKGLPKKEVSVDRDAQGWLNIRSGAAHFRITTMDAGEFPEMPRKKDFTFFKADVDTLALGLSYTTYAMSNDEMRLNLNGVLLEQKDGFLHCVATDAHRLALYSQKLNDGSSYKLDRRVILPRKGINELKRYLAEVSGKTLDVAFTPAYAVFAGERTVLFMKLVVGEFPDFGKVIPSGERQKLTVNRKNFAEALRRVALLSDGKSRCVRFGINSDHVHLQANSPELGEAEEKVPAEYTGTELLMGFNAKYMLDAISVADSENIVLELEHDQSPGVIKLPGVETYCSVIMPMRI